MMKTIKVRIEDSTTRGTHTVKVKCGVPMGILPPLFNAVKKIYGPNAMLLIRKVTQKKIVGNVFPQYPEMKFNVVNITHDCETMSSMDFLV